MTTILERVTFVHALELPPNAVIIVHCDIAITPEQGAELQRQVRDAIPGHKVMITSGPVTIDAIVPTNGNADMSANSTAQETHS